MLYLDNAATTVKKPWRVYAAMAYNTLFYSANAGRGAHRLSLRNMEKIIETQELIAQLFNISDPQNIAFTQNATYALNMAILGTKGHVVVTQMEHNSVLRPVHCRGNYSVAKADMTGFVSAEAVEKEMREDTRLVVCTHASNVCGTIEPVEEIARIARKHNALFLIDAAQTAGCVEIDAQKTGADFIAFSGHKGLMGPGGIGALLLSHEFAKALTPIVTGGTGSASDSEEQPSYMPDKFESGTPNLPGIYGFHAAVEFIKETGVDTFRAHETHMAKRFLDGISGISGVRLAGPADLTDRVAVISLDFIEKDNAEVAFALEQEFGIMTRCGLHCAPSAHKTLGTFPQGTVRFSPGWFTTDEEIDVAISAIRTIAER